jgi:hypothetical protein
LGKQGNGILEFSGNRIKRVLEMRDMGKGWRGKGKLLKENLMDWGVGNLLSKNIGRCRFSTPILRIIGT